MGEEAWRRHLEVESKGLMRIRKHNEMKVDAMLVSSPEHLDKGSDNRSISQLINIASMPGVVGEAWAMADWHFGYGFPIGGVLATDVEWGEQGGSISPGGVGFDINCGVRMIALDCHVSDIPNIDKLAGRLNGRIPSGGSGKGGLDINRRELDEIISRGSNAMVDMGYAYDEDLANIESKGSLENNEGVSNRAMNRGMKSLGTLGSGNHFLELQTVDSVEDSNPYGLFENQVVCMIHSGSRGLGHQVCTDHVRRLEEKYRNRNGVWSCDEWGFEIMDRQLAAAPIHSKEGIQYLDAMNGAANFAFANRSALTHRLRQALSKEIDVETRLIYDVSHNIAKIEEHVIHGKNCNCAVHRKGATRALPNQPVLVPGDMGTGSWLLEGIEGNRAFASSCHGAGRMLSRTQAKKVIDGREVQKNLANRGIRIHANTPNILSEEAPEAYKDVDEVIELSSAAGLTKPVARLSPFTVIKG